ncbi:hypothetical protein LTR64_000820 [Lithohypha guttulata]|uniref:uncharacterized protein n=1 Tax=Lithohypha guttulata TaxID=1690604 RepID=UPI002DE0BFFE|nr:hypothetical protein LTR51_005414 [Lithohypha guttulata]
MLFPPASTPRGPKVATKKALLLIDFQNEFTAPAGKLYVPNTATFVSKLPTLANKFREDGEVIWVKTVFQHPCSSLSPQTGGYSILTKSLAEHLAQRPRDDVSTTDNKSIDETRRRRRLPAVQDDDEAFLSPRTPVSERCCLAGTNGSELSSELVSSLDQQKDLILNKFQYSALADFSFLLKLRARLVNDLYICGSLTNIGVHATVLDAAQQGFNVTLIEDCLGFRNYTCHLQAMRQMADDLGASGIDYQELMDDLHGLLGDVIPANRYTREFQTTQQQLGGRGQLSRSQKVSQWITTVESDSETEKQPATMQDYRNRSSFRSAGSNVTHDTMPQHNESCIRDADARRPPSRKRSASNREESEEVNRPSSRTSAPDAEPRAEPDSSTKTISASKSLAAQRSIQESPSAISKQNCSTLSAMGQAHSTSHIETAQHSDRRPPAADRASSQPAMTTNSRSPKVDHDVKRRKKKYDPTYLEPDEQVGDGESMVIHDVLSKQEADRAFTKLKNDVTWQKMYHRTGAVPRLVAVQGTIAEDGSIPIYRHPADESPPLLPFDETVDQLRRACEQKVGHKLNHVLIQLYRNGEDNISEHSDKTLDIVRDSSIVNLSIGAMRTMTLRTKRSSQPSTTRSTKNGNMAPTAPLPPESEYQPRAAQRIKLPHNSIFVLGEKTNANWLHSIRADKRPMCEKSDDELAFGGERISLTFRHIGTFVDLQNRLIWGQGSTGRTREDARAILKGNEAGVVGEEMIIGFGKENRLSGSEWDWNAVYGKGFDAVNWDVKVGPDESKDDCKERSSNILAG